MHRGDHGSTDPSGLLAKCWAAVGGDAGALEGLTVVGFDAWLGGPLPVDRLALAAVSAALLAAADLAAARASERPRVEVSAEHVALSFRSERHALIGGVPAGAGFAPLSRLVRCRGGGWARTHGNYPHHAAALGRALSIDVEREPELAVAELDAAAGSLDSVALEERVIAAGGCAAALRSEDEWASHPAGRAAADGPLVAWDDSLATRSPRPLGAGERAAARPAAQARQTPARPAAGVRVLDLTRVIAGPVAGRTLAALGADVLRVDSPGLAELPEQHVDTGPGKRSAELDLADAERRERLLAGADVVLVGYRPGSLARFGLESDRLVARHPHLVQVWLSAWGPTGPWADRRGFDSLVQVASGLAATAGVEGTPGALPAQALDHATGHLMAAAALRGLVNRAHAEPITPARLSLARTASALLDAPRPVQPRTAATGAADPEGHRAVFGDVSLIAPPGAFDEIPLRWAHGPRRLGADEPAWT